MGNSPPKTVIKVCQSLLWIVSTVARNAQGTKINDQPIDQNARSVENLTTMLPSVNQKLTDRGYRRR